MEKSTGPSRVPSKLSKSLDRHLHAYAVAAGAAGVGLLALSQPAEAELIHKVVNVKINMDERYKLELNRIGVVDFVFYATATGLSNGNAESALRLFAYNGNEVWVSNGDPAVLGNDVTIGPGGNFENHSVNLMVGSYDEKFRSGNWGGDVKRKFLGFKFFDLAGKPHYGWARLDVNSPYDVTLIDYEYDNTEYTPVKTCKGSSSTSVVDEESGILKAEDAVESSGSPTLGHLAAGAAAIDYWRAESTATK
jgi:hypothetical protein